MKCKICRVLLLGTIIVSCKKQGFYVGGQVKDPVLNYVELSDEDEFRDTLYLDAENKFGAFYENRASGVYILKHSREIKPLYLQNQDSVFVRLNFNEFDESLVFTGRGFEKSEFLATRLRFLEDSNFEKKLYRLPPDEFLKKTDSIYLVLQNQRKQFMKEFKNLPQKFIDITDKGMLFLVGIFKENYPARYARYQARLQKSEKKKKKNKIPENYYDFRKDIDLNQLEPYHFKSYAFRLYNVALIRNISAQEKQKYPSKNLYLLLFENAIKYAKHPHIPSLHFMSYVLTTHRLDKNVFAEFIKFSSAQGYASEKDFRNSATLFLEENALLKKGTRIKNFTLLDPQNNKVKFYDLTKGQRTFLILWDQTFLRESLVGILRGLKVVFPEVHFLLIDTDKKKRNYNQKFFIKTYRFLRDSLPEFFKQDLYHRNILLDEKQHIISPSGGFWYKTLRECLGEFYQKNNFKK